ncbi:50S ribosomal protein L11 methyltransferase [Bryobacterales bacterium F-183]|nr:50S ribosomal protein L11 methyltransferase [Bryobacterales bacterium F-183]
MFSLLIASDLADPQRDLIVQRLWEAGTLGIVEGDQTLEAFFDDESVIETLADLHPQRIEPEDVDWEEETRRSFPPVTAGAKFFVVPPWNEDPTPAGRVRLVINPGSACGTGYHPCTRMCLQLLEQYVKPGNRVLDVGAGSGILSKAVAILEGHAVACDIDPDSIEHCDWQPKFTGSVDAVAAGSFDIVVANISPEVHRAMLPEYRRVARTLILSGFEELEPQADEVQRLELDGWQALVIKAT